MIRLLHVVTGLGGGGAETMLARLSAALPRSEFEQQVLSLTEDGPIGARLRAADVPVATLGLRRATDLPRGLAGLAGALRRFRPDVIQTWLVHADLLTGLVARALGAAPVVWGVHQAGYDPATTPRATRLALAIAARLSGVLPARVVSCAAAGRAARLASGFPSDLMEVIPNGVDLDEFRPDAEARARLRGEFGLAPDAPVIGMPARWHVDKDHAVLTAAAREVLARVPGARFVLCGADINAGNAELAALLAATCRPEAFSLLGFRADMARVLPAFDIGVLASRTEAFPNVVTETMAAGVPFVATAVGDVPEIIGATGRVVPPRDPAALAAALLELLALPEDARRALGAAARARVAEHFALASSVARYAALYRELAARR